jgi:hypothetical protein
LVFAELLLEPDGEVLRAVAKVVLHCFEFRLHALDKEFQRPKLIGEGNVLPKA